LYSRAAQDLKESAKLLIEDKLQELRLFESSGFRIFKDRHSLYAQLWQGGAGNGGYSAPESGRSDQRKTHSCFPGAQTNVVLLADGQESCRPRSASVIASPFPPQRRCAAQWLRRSRTGYATTWRPQSPPWASPCTAWKLSIRSTAAGLNSDGGCLPRFIRRGCF